MKTLQERMALAFPLPRKWGLFAEIARLCGVSSPTVTAWFNKPEKVATLERANAEKLCQAYALKYSPRWLAEGVGPMLAAEEPGSETSATGPVPISLENNPEYPAVRRVIFKLSAGASGFGVEYSDEEGPPIVFRRDWYDRNGYRPEKLLAVRVSNGSMEPGLYDGDTVIVNTDAAEPVDGAVFAVNYEGEMVVKRLVRDAGQWWLSSDNPDQRRYPRKVCDEHCQLLGRIVHKQSERI